MVELKRRPTQVDARELGESLVEVLDVMECLDQSGLLIERARKEQVLGRAVILLAGGAGFGSHVLDWVIAESGLDRRKVRRAKRA